MIKKCETCTIEFSGKNKSSRFCSRKCMYSWRKDCNWEEVNCLKCNNPFKRRKKEIHRSSKLPKQYCSNICSLTSDEKKNNLKKWGLSEKNHFNDQQIQEKAKITKKQKYNDEFFNGIVKNEYSSFVKIYNSFKNRAEFKNKEFHLSLQDLKEQWEKQNGKCIYSNIELELPNKNKIPPFKIASIDRINSNIGYNKNNIQFVSMMCNFAKNKFSHEEMLKFCQLIKQSK